MLGNRANRIVKNTIFLYTRSIIVMILAVYTSRVLLSTLGVDDFGLYNVVGGIVIMFSSIKGVLASAVQRFINYEKGRGDANRVNDIVSSSIIIHLFIATLFVIVLEPIGCWYIIHKLVIPDGSVGNAIFVFHCSVAATFFSIATIPYDALVIANEKMSFYAGLSIFDAVFKLLIIFLLPILPYAYLKSYALLILLITLIHRLITLVYCRRIPEAHFKLQLNKKVAKELGAFAGWNFLGGTASNLIEEGSNLILNAFGGVVVNTARGLAYQVKSAVSTISSNVVVASQPYVTQQSAVVEDKKFFSYIHLQSKVVFLCTSLIVLPLYIYSSNILSLWLKEVPQYANEFMRAVLIYTVVMSFQKPIDLAFKSYGKIAKYQMLDTAILLLTLPVVYLLLKVKLPMHFAFYGFSAVRLIDYGFVLLLARKEINMNIKDYIKKVCYPSIKECAIFIVLVLFFEAFCKANNLFMLFLWIFLVVLVAILLVYLLALNTEEKRIIKEFVSSVSHENIKV